MRASSGGSIEPTSKDGVTCEPNHPRRLRRLSTHTLECNTLYNKGGHTSTVTYTDEKIAGWRMSHRNTKGAYIGEESKDRGLLLSEWSSFRIGQLMVGKGRDPSATFSFIVM